MHRAILPFLTTLFAVATAHGARAEAPPQFALPVACDMGSDCVIQNYFDTDPGPGWRDHACGKLSYDGHDGTDFRVRDYDLVRRGVTVVAAAPGEVIGIRDGMRDHDGSAISSIPSDRACGNGVGIDHGGGWTTQYCHLRLGSIIVKPGQTVAAGDALGFVGQSGHASFPHVHFEIRRDTKSLDPFASTQPGNGEAARASTCGNGDHWLWRADLTDDLTYEAPLILNTGFAAQGIAMIDIDTRAKTLGALHADAPALVFYGRAIGTSQGDRQRITILMPNGEVFHDRLTDPEPRARAQVMAFSGKKRPERGWPAGTYTATYQIIRDGKPVAARSDAITLNAN